MGDCALSSTPAPELLHMQTIGPRILLGRALQAHRREARRTGIAGRLGDPGLAGTQTGQAVLPECREHIATLLNIDTVFIKQTTYQYYRITYQAGYNLSLTPVREVSLVFPTPP